MKRRILRGVALGLLAAVLASVVALFAYQTATDGFSAENLTRMLLIVTGVGVSVVKLIGANASTRRRRREFYAAYHAKELGGVFLRKGQERARTDLLEGIRLYHEDRCAKAIGRLKHALRGAVTDEDLTACYLFLALSYTDLGDLSAAVEAYRTLLDRCDGHAVAWGNLGRLKTESGDRAGGIEAYRRAIVCDPSYALAYANLAQALAFRGDFAEAIRAGERALDLDAHLKTAAHALAVSHYALGDKAQADTFADRYAALGGDPAELRKVFSEIDAGSFPPA
jgi:tetratricopeptide (TPR) repeat protein